MKQMTPRGLFEGKYILCDNNKRSTLGMLI